MSCFKYNFRKKCSYDVHNEEFSVAKPESGKYNTIRLHQWEAAEQQNQINSLQHANGHAHVEPEILDSHENNNDVSPKEVPQEEADEVSYNQIDEADNEVNRNSAPDHYEAVAPVHAHEEVVTEVEEEIPVVEAPLPMEAPAPLEEPVYAQVDKSQSRAGNREGLYGEDKLNDYQKACMEMEEDEGWHDYGTTALGASQDDYEAPDDDDAVSLASSHHEVQPDNISTDGNVLEIEQNDENEAHFTSSENTHEVSYDICDTPPGDKPMELVY